MDFHLDNVFSGIGCSVLAIYAGSATIVIISLVYYLLRKDKTLKHYEIGIDKFYVVSKYKSNENDKIKALLLENNSLKEQILILKKEKRAITLQTIAVLTVSLIGLMIIYVSSKVRRR